MITDENVLAVRRAREALLRRYDGLDGWIRHLQSMDRRRAEMKKATRRQRGAVRRK
jgi:hypothetical protein